MKNIKVLDTLKETGKILLTIIVSHYVGKSMDAKDNAEQAKQILENKNALLKLSSEKNEESENVRPFVENINKNIVKLENYYKNSDSNNTTSNVIEEINTNAISEKNFINHILKSLNNYSSELNKFLESLSSNTNNFISDFNINKLYEYLDSITLLQESALINILIFILILITVFNIITSMFANEIIKYFNIETKYPKLTNILKLRITLQKYYFMWSTFSLFMICLVGIAINMFTFYMGL